MRRFLAAVLLAAVLGACGSDAPTPVPRLRAADVFLSPDTELIAGRVPPRATLEVVLRESRLREDLVPKVVELAASVFDPRRLRADNPFKLERTLEGLLRSFEYEIDTDSFLRIVGLSDEQPAELRAEIVPYKKERVVTTASGLINRDATSLFAAMELAGEGPQLSIELADVFGGEIDFNSELQPGDTFRVAFEKVYREGTFSGYGGVLAAEFVNVGHSFKALRYTVPGGKPAYYDEQGRSLKRFFLKSPLKFEASISSRFTHSRRHPILRIVRPHLGVDYRAPIGASVVAVANGTVVSAGWSGGAGRMVTLRHPGGWETLYMHLSSIAVRRGQHVSQGQLIGRVGSSGLSTGPHLDYRVRQNGRYLNPLVVHRSLPPGEPIPAAHLAAFREEFERSWALLSATEATPVEGAPGAVKAASEPAADPPLPKNVR
ncbi:MAG: M23 family metallopeptidase [Acidobacteria bacterium]|nr:M23 family metallopeptidase [Acidobacteriota bacterium]